MLVNRNNHAAALKSCDALEERGVCSGLFEAAALFDLQRYAYVECLTRLALNNTSVAKQSLAETFFVCACARVWVWLR